MWFHFNEIHKNIFWYFIGRKLVPKILICNWCDVVRKLFLPGRFMFSFPLDSLCPRTFDCHNIQKLKLYSWPWQRQQLPLIKCLQLLANRDNSFKVKEALSFPVKILLKEKILNLKISYSSHHLNNPKDLTPCGNFLTST